MSTDPTIARYGRLARALDDALRATRWGIDPHDDAHDPPCELPPLHRRVHVGWYSQLGYFRIISDRHGRLHLEQPGLDREHLLDGRPIGSLSDAVAAYEALESPCGAQPQPWGGWLGPTMAEWDAEHERALAALKCTEGALHV